MAKPSMWRCPSLPERHRLCRPGRQPPRAHGIGAQPCRGSSRPARHRAGLAATASATALSDVSVTSAPFAIIVPFRIERGQQLAHRRHRRRLAAGRDRPAPATAPAARPSATRAARRRPAPQRPATAANTIVRHSRRAHRSRWRFQNPVAPEGCGQVDKERPARPRACLRTGHVDPAAAVRRRRRQWARVAGDRRKATVDRPAPGRQADRRPRRQDRQRRGGMSGHSQ